MKIGISRTLFHTEDIEDVTGLRELRIRVAKAQPQLVQEKETPLGNVGLEREGDRFYIVLGNYRSSSFRTTNEIDAVKLAQDIVATLGAEDTLTSKLAQAICKLQIGVGEEVDAEVQSIAADPNLKARWLANIDKILKSDEVNKQLLIDVGISAYGPNPLNLFMKGPASTGKSVLTVTSMSYFPQEDVWFLGGMTPKALVRDKASFNEETKKFYVNLTNKILVFLESPALETLRLLYPVLSHDKLEIEYKIAEKTGKGKILTRTVVIRGWPATVFCTTQLKFLEELSSRGLTATPEINQAKFRKVIKAKAARIARPWKHLETDVEKELIRKFIRTLRTEESELKKRSQVVIPYGEQIGEFFPSKQATHQREFDKFTELVAINARLHRHQRAIITMPINEEEVPFIVANGDDYEAARRIYEHIAPATVSGVPSYIIEWFQNVLKPLAPETDPQQVRSKHREVYGEGIGERKYGDHINILKDAGWISESKNPLDKREKIINVEQPSLQKTSPLKSFTEFFTKKHLEAWVDEVQKYPAPQEDRGGYKVKTTLGGKPIDLYSITSMESKLFFPTPTEQPEPSAATTFDVSPLKLGFKERKKTDEKVVEK